MLETGKDCLVCGQRKVLKDFSQDFPVCISCDDERMSDLVDNQIELRSRKDDWGVARCECGHYFERFKKNKKGRTVVFKECAICRAKKDYAKSAKESGATIEKIEKKSTPGKEQITTPKSSENGIKNDTTEKRQEKEKPHTETKTNKKLENISESIMQKTKKTNEEKSSSAENAVTLPLDSMKPSMILRREQLGLVNSLNDMSGHLIDLGKSLAKPRLDDDGEIIQMTQPHNVDTAIKCFQEARSMMKVKLEALRFGKDILNEHK